MAREVLEETDISVEVTDLVGVFSNPEHVIAYDDGEVRQEFSICFRARPIGGSLRTSEESKEVLWVTPAAADSLNVHPSISLRIERGLEAASPYFT
ncbi:NUDIX hydrolase [Nocardia sp. NPDC055029]